MRGRPALESDGSLKVSLLLALVFVNGKGGFLKSDYGHHVAMLE